MNQKSRRENENFTSWPSKFKQREDLRIHLRAENEDCYTVQDLHLALDKLFYVSPIFKHGGTLISMEFLFKCIYVSV